MPAVTRGRRSAPARRPRSTCTWRVGPLRPDGFHELATVYLAVSLFDTVTVAPGDGLTLRVSGEGTAASGAGSVPTDRRNLVWRAAELLAGTPACGADADIAIDKSIPAAAGPGRGQRGRRGRPRRPRRALGHPRRAAPTSLDLAAQLGSDVPFSLLGGVALGAGPRRAALAGARPRARRTGCSGIAGEGLSTPAVYAELDRLRAAGARARTATALTSPEPGARRAAQRDADRPGRRARATTCRRRR